MFKEHLEKYNEELCDLIDALDAEKFQKIIDILLEARKQDRTVFITGNGGSAGTANHFVCDFGKNAVLDPEKKRFKIISLCDNIEKVTALGNDFAFEEIFSQQLKNLMREEDVLILVSASGNSPDLVEACKYAKTKNAHMVALAGFEGGKISEYAEVSIVAKSTSYERIEDLHLIILHQIVAYLKDHQELL